MEDFKIGDKVVFKKGVLNKLHDTEYVESSVGCGLAKSYLQYLKSNSNFEKLGYFEVLGFSNNGNDLDIGLYIGKDLFGYYQGKCSYEKGDKLTIGNYEGIIRYAGTGYYLDLDARSKSLLHWDVCDKLKKFFGKDTFINLACKYNAINCVTAFPEFNSIEDLVNFVKELNKLISPKKESDSIITKNDQNNEIKFQRAKVSSKRGVVPTGRAICGRRRKTAIKLGHLSNATCHC